MLMVSVRCSFRAILDATPWNAIAVLGTTHKSAMSTSRPTSVGTVNPNDEIRRQILEYFYNRNSAATSRFGKKGSASKISDVKRELKSLFSLTQQQVMSNLTYLIDRGWIKTVDKEKTVAVAGGTIPSTVTWYEITALGIEKIEGDSEFKPVDRYAGINITAGGNSVITMGDGNVVNVAYRQLHEALDELKQAVTLSRTLTETIKLETAVDIESLKDQLAKQQPNRQVVRTLWTSIQNAVTGADFIELLAKIGPAISGLLS
jgi:hypothetical protein